ncbi:hypothetical protein [Streptomyces purpureus]|uniref:Uncharacterized protein n=1 Tax=Streptomyces purpureus TaxID=1951 RepID=A0A918GXK7_9ACTN|nr:hypothetical protein [Streptomyces purpureus]GGT11735.1 hypothetical protein GCM10014713_00120 [Streptomyces purpureus]
MSEPQDEPPRPGPLGGLDSPGALLRVVVAQGTFIAALLFYLGAMYTSTFYRYFHISLNSLDLGFGEQVTQSLHLLKLEVLVAAGVIVLLVAAPWVRRRARTGARAYGGGAPPVSKLEVVAGRASLAIVAAGVVLLALWTEIQPYGWVAPLVIAAGLLLSQCRDSAGRRPRGFRRRALPVFVAGAFVFWALTQVTVETARRDAGDHARRVADWTGVVVLSSHPLALPTGGGLQKEVLPGGLLHRYRYSGLRLLLERNGRYFVVPLGWNARTDAIYVIRESDTTWIGLTPGTQPRVLGLGA